MAFKLNEEAYNINWSTGDSSTSLALEHPGTCSVHYRMNANCLIRDTIKVSFDTLYKPPLKDTVFCERGELRFSPEQDHTYQWGHSPAISPILFDSTGPYTLHIEKNQCGDSLSLFIDIENKYQLSPSDTLLCEGRSFLFEPEIT